MISTKTHGYLDYMMGILLIILPFLLGFPKGVATIFPIVLGAGTILYSLLTDYELGMATLIDMRTHLGMDMIAGLVLATAPWIFNFADEVLWPFVILGVIEMGAAIMTNKTGNKEEKAITKENTE